MKTILVIDDKKSNLITIKAVIKDKLPNSKVLTALSGKEGIKTAQDEQPDTILLDIIMPEMDGYEVCERLKADESTKHIPIIMVTAIKADSSIRAKGLNCGADAFLSKPVDENELVAQLNAMFRIKEAEDKLQLKLNERNKELNCLYGISKVVETSGITFDGIIKEIVNLIPPAWQYPKITCVRIILKNNEYKTDNFLETKWKQSADIIVHKEIAGEITVCYLEEKPKCYEGPFIQEERNLIDVIAERLGRIADRKQAEERLRKSESIQRKMVSNIGDVVVIVDKKGINRYKSPNVKKQFGWEVNELIGKSTFEKVHKDDLDNVKTMFAMLVSEPEKPITTELRYLCKDGKYRCIQMTISNLLDDPDINGFLGNYHDITERKLANETLHSSEEMLLSSQSLANICSYSTNLIVAEIGKSQWECSPEFYNIFGIDETYPHTIEGWIGFLHPDYREDLIAYHESVILEKKSFNREYKIIRINDGIERWVHGTGELVYDKKGNPIRMHGAIQDITEHKQAELDLIAKNKELIKAKEKAEESDRLKSAFLATMSHELRTPLNAVIGFSSLINENVPIKDIVSYCKTINSSGDHLLKIVEDLFDITLIEAGEVNLSIEKANLDNLLQEVHQIISVEQQKQKKSHIDFKLSILENHKDLVINTDPSKLKQVLINLLKNALKFTHSGHIRYGFEIETNKKNQGIRFFVEDTGIGISKEQHEAIFEAFGQVEDTHTKTYGGTGIGLSLSKKITEILGGEIWLESELDKGSTFYFTIPLSVIVNAEILDKPKNKEVNKGTNYLANKTILVVEDDETSSDFLEIILGDLDIITLKAQDGVEAIKRCQEESTIDLVLMDINMPVMNGLIATKEIKKFKPELPIIAQTAYAIAGDKEKAIDAGCDDYISKPIKHEVLMEKLNKYLR